jgi:hypothetical protein
MQMPSSATGNQFGIGNTKRSLRVIPSTPVETSFIDKHAYTPMLRLPYINNISSLFTRSQYISAHQSSHASSCFFGGGAVVLLFPMPIALVPIAL